MRAVIGPNGAGKSTLFNLITGVLKPSQGSVRFAGENITGLSVPRICQRGIARTFQLTALFPRDERARECPPRRPGPRAPALAVLWRSSRVFAAAGERADAALERLGLVADRRSPGRAAVAWRPAPARSRDGLGAGAAAAAARRADARPFGRGDGAGGRDPGRAARRGRHDRAAGRARYGGRVPPRATHHGAASRRRYRRRLARSGQAGRSACRRPISAGSPDAARIEALNAHYGASHVLQGVDLEVPDGTIARGARAATGSAKPRPCARSWVSCRRARAACCWTARTLPAGRRIGSPAPGWPMSRKGG